ncbi:MAG: MerR family transcriptional regulator [Anaerolineales bacterium]|nr:MerR family transcriptional regulator [Anaerolineales bacterium]
MPYTIKEIADLAGVSTRTLRYYDQIGLLSPAETGENNYRYYNRASLLRLQQILFYRELDVPLKQIQHIMAQPDFNPLQALQEHRQALQTRAARLERLIETVDQTIATLQGEWMMSEKDYFEGFDENQYTEEVEQRWGHTPQYAESQRKWNSYSKAKKETIKAEGSQITRRMVGDDPELKPDDPDVQAAVGDYYAYLNKYFYRCNLEFLRNLAEMWVQDARFAANYERIRTGGAEFVRQAVIIYCERQAG